MLVGEYKGQKLQLYPLGNPKYNTGITLSVAYPFFNEREQKTTLAQKTIYEVDEPTRIFQTVFAKRDEKSRNLFFYDDRLARVDPATEWLFVEAKSFKYDGDVVIIKNKLKEEQKLSTENRLEADTIANQRKLKVSTKVRNRLI